MIEFRNLHKSFDSLAVLRGTPFSALPYASKVTGLLDDLGMDTPPLEAIGIGELIARIDRKWDTRAEVRTRIGERLPALRQRAKLPNQALMRMLGECASLPL